MTTTETSESSNVHDRLLELSEQACNGTLNAEDYIQLDALLSLSHRNRLLYIEYVHLHATLEQISVGADREPVQLRDEPRPRRFAGMLTAGSVLLPLVLAGLIYFWGPGQRDDAGNLPPDGATSAWLASIGKVSDDAKWTVEGQDRGMQIFTDQLMHIDEGCVELRFRNGTRIAAEGPAELVVNSDLLVDMTSGALRVTLDDERAAGFRVITDAMEIVDRGTQFYVEIGEDGGTTSYVSQGICEIRNRLALQDELLPFRVSTAGECVLIDRERKLLPLGSELSRDICERMVSKFLSYDASLREASPCVCVIPPPDELLDHRFCSANHPVYLIPERQRVPLHEDLILPGEPPIRLPAGTLVDSFLVHNAFGPDLPETASRQVVRKVRTSGHIVFSRPVLAVVSGYEHLSQTDAPFAPENANYASAGRRRQKVHDRLSRSSADSRRVDFDFPLAEGEFQQARILVRSNANPRSAIAVREGQSPFVGQKTK